MHGDACMCTMQKVAVALYITELSWCIYIVASNECQ